MIASRRVLCSFDCDSAQSFLASQMENWQRTIAATQPERPTKVRRNSNATGSKDDLERQLLLISTRLGLRNARDVSLLNSICYSTVKLPKDHAVCVAAAEARRAHATRTRGKSGHGEGSPDEYACLALNQNLQDAHGQNAIKEFLDAHPPKDKKLAAAVRCCRVQEEWGGTHVKFYFRLSPAETNIMTALEQSRGDRLYGEAPRGSLERKSLDLLHKLGVQIDKPIGS